MKERQQETVRTLNSLYRLNKDSERGLETVAEHVNNRGLKVMLKHQARQRSQFALELQSAIKQSGAVPRNGGSPLATVHRGWIDIKTGLTIGTDNIERAALAESERGESFASRSYDKALELDLPDDIKQILRRHAGLIRESHEQIALLAGLDDRTMVVQLFDSPAAADSAIENIQNSGINASRIETSDLANVAQEYHCDCHMSRVLESGVTGAILGAVAGATLGIIAGSAALFDPAIAAMGSGELLAATVIIGLISGGILGGLFGLLIGHSTAENDEFLYGWSLRSGKTLVSVEADRRQAGEIRQMLRSVNRRAVASG